MVSAKVGMGDVLAASHAVGKRFEPTRCIAPPADRPFTDNRPHPAVTSGMRAIGGRRFRRSRRMGVPVANHRISARSCRSVRIYQCLRIDFEMPFGFWMDIPAQSDFAKFAFAAEEQPACLPRMDSAGICDHFVDQGA